MRRPHCGQCVKGSVVSKLHFMQLLNSAIFSSSNDGFLLPSLSPGEQGASLYSLLQAIVNLLRAPDLGSNHLAGDDDLHAPIFLPAGGGSVVCDRVGFAQACGRD